MTTFAMETLLSLMRKIGVKNFQTGDWMEFVGEEVLLVDDIAKMPDFSSVMVKIESVQIVFCLEGRLDVTIDDKVHTVQKGEILFLSSNMVVSHYKLSEDIRAKVLIFSLKAIEDSIYLQRRIWKNIQYAAENPVFRPTEEEWQIIRRYYDIFKTSGRSEARYQQDIVTHLLRSLILEFLLMTDNQLEGSEDVAHVSHNPQVLLSRFTEELGKSEGKIRSVEAFAEILHVTPRQLSSAIKTASGRNAMDWIHENTAKIIARELKYSDKTIQEICNDMDFVGLQSFGKFCRQNLGLAPREFRNKYRS